MAHPGTGSTITVADYNTIVALINALFGTSTGDKGYGGNSSNVALANLVNIASGSIITNEDWLVLRNAQGDMASHQGTTLSAALPSITDMEDGDDAKAFEDQSGPDNPDGEIDSPENFTLFEDNRAIVSPGNVTVTTRLSNERTIPWSDFIEHEFTVDFGSTDNARFFFNTGGQIRLSATRTGGSATAQNTLWDTLLADGGTFIFDGVSYFALTSNFSSASPVGQVTTAANGVYENNNWAISAKRDDAAGSNGGNGSIIRFKSAFLDGHMNVFSDLVDGTFTSTIEDRRSTGVFIRPVPTYTDIIGVGAAVSPSIFNVVIGSDINDYNLRNDLIANYSWDGITATDVTVTINNGITVGSTNISNTAFVIENFPLGSTLTMTNNGRIQGKGGNGGRGQGGATVGQTGGTAINTTVPITINNSSGDIWGGGGGGGGGAGSTTNPPGNAGGGGGGGAGTNPGTGGPTGSFSGGGPGNSGSPGTATSGGSGGLGGGGGGGMMAAGGDGGNGGGPGSAGSTGQNVGTILGTVGGAAGNAINGVSFITFAGAGNILGPQIG